MSKAFVLMKAMPPTTGHLDLIDFADQVSRNDPVTVIVDTAPDEPMIDERIEALRMAVSDLSERSYINVVHIENTRENPSEDGFWSYWQGLLIGLGFRPDDLIVGSESYCKELATWVSGIYVPYDPDRSINPVRATDVRKNPARWWDYILPEFRHHLQLRVTIFGAESTGKTTLVDALAERHNGHSMQIQPLPEYARPYLENTENYITKASMTAIWKGQRALQQMPFLDVPVILQDTDLFSTVGYWKFFQFAPDGNFTFPKAPLRREIGACPDQLVYDARDLQSDLYLITPSNIDFTPDPLRYGGDHREMDDLAWFNYAALHKLNYHILDCDPGERVDVATRLIDEALQKKLKKIAYDRPFQ